MADENTLVKKVAPYPIMAHILKAEGQPPFKASIAKLTDFGFLAKVDTSHFYQVGENYILHFTLPLSENHIQAAVKVVKTYDAIESVVGTEKIKLYTIEMHFSQISDKNKKDIQNFIVKIGQVKIGQTK